MPPATSLLDNLSRILREDTPVEGSSKNVLLGFEVCIIDKREIYMAVDDYYIRCFKWIRRARLFESLKKTKE